MVLVGVQSILATGAAALHNLYPSISAQGFLLLTLVLCFASGWFVSAARASSARTGIDPAPVAPLTDLPAFVEIDVSNLEPLAPTGFSGAVMGFALLLGAVPNPHLVERPTAIHRWKR